MIRYMIGEEQKAFWERHAEARKRIDEDMAKLPYEKKMEIAEKLQADYEVMRTLGIKRGLLG